MPHMSLATYMGLFLYSCYSALFLFYYTHVLPMWYPYGHDSLQSHAIFAQKYKRKKYARKFHYATDG